MNMPAHALDPRAAARRSRLGAVGATLALIALGLAWELVLAPTGARSLVLKVAPLAVLLPGLVRMRLSTYRATSLWVWLYALEGALRAVSDSGLSAQLAVIELMLAFALFAACVLHVRARVGPRQKAAR
jgi:uncharacterized membrane protein